MPTDKTSKKSRKVLEIANKYQQVILLLVFTPSVLMFLSFIAIVFIGNSDFSKLVFHTTFKATPNLVNLISEWIIGLMTLFFLMSLIGAFIISHKMVGASGRIIRELDEIIAGRSQKTITCRQGDTLTKAFLDRVNVLVKSYVKQDRKNN